MSQKPEESTTPQLDRWVEEVGEEEVLRIIEEVKTAIEDGTITGFTDKASFLESWNREHRRSA